MPWSPNWHDDFMIELKTAEEWHFHFKSVRIPAHVDVASGLAGIDDSMIVFVRQIQANALRWAADQISKRPAYIVHDELCEKADSLEKHK
jgi:hypothetical protein